MEIKVLTIERSRFEAIPEAERLFYVQIAQICNEMRMLGRLLVFVSTTGSEPPLVADTNLGQSLLLARILAGKCEEAWQVLDTSFHGAQVSRTVVPSLNAQGREAYKKICRYFGRPNLAHKIRNEFAFHFDSERIRAELGRIDPDERLRIFLAQQQGNSFYDFAEKVTARALLEIAEESEYEQAVRKILTDITQLANAFTAFGDSCMVRMVTEYIAATAEDASIQTVVIEGLPHPDEVRIPYFVETW